MKTEGHVSVINLLIKKGLVGKEKGGQTQFQLGPTLEAFTLFCFWIEKAQKMGLKKSFRKNAVQKRRRRE